MGIGASGLLLLSLENLFLISISLIKYRNWYFFIPMMKSFHWFIPYKYNYGLDACKTATFPKESFMNGSPHMHYDPYPSFGSLV